MRVVIPDHIDIDVRSRKILEEIPNIHIFDDTNNDPTAIVERIRDAEVITANYIDITSEIIEKSPKLRFIISPAVGYEWIDVKSATEKGIKILNCPTYNSQAVAEHAIALMFAVNRKLLVAREVILSGKFSNRNDLLGSEVMGKTLVMMGHGNVGKRIEKMAEGLGMKTRWTDSKTSVDETDKLIADADVLVMCLPLNESTNGILNSRRINLLKKTAIVINVARGLVIEQNSFFESLKENKILGAGIDVFPNDETLDETRQDIMNFAKLPNVVVTPHIAFKTNESVERLGNELLVNIKSCLDGSPINVVN